MGYIKAEKILPKEIIEIIQTYIDGESIYIPRKENERTPWGNNTTIKEELENRNIAIYKDYKTGKSVAELAEMFYLSQKSIQRILRQMKSSV